MASMASSEDSPSSNLNSRPLSKEAMLAIADVFFQDGKPRAHREPRTNFALLGAQPAAVRDDGIDLAVMRDVAERLRQMPGRLGVRGITLVKNGEGGLERRVAQVFIKLGELPRRQETFIDNRL